MRNKRLLWTLLTREDRPTPADYGWVAAQMSLLWHRQASMKSLKMLAVDVSSDRYFGLRISLEGLILLVEVEVGAGEGNRTLV